MKNSNLVSFKEYIIDVDSLTYKAVWNCQVEWTDECIFYDAETGRVVIEDDEVEFVAEHRLQVTKHEYLEHAAEAETLPGVSEAQLRQQVGYGQVG